MIDPVLERRLGGCRTLLKLWGMFQEFFEAAVKGQTVQPDNERKFLELKSRIAMLHDTFLECAEEKSAAVAQNMLENVIRAITLKHISKLSPADIKKMQIEWQESYLLLNETIGLLEEEQINKARISATRWHTQQMGKSVSRVISNIFHSWGLRLSIIAGAALFALVGLPLMGVFSYGALRDVAAIQKPVFLVIQKVIRPFIDKNLSWRTIDEAATFGKRTFAEVGITDFVEAKLDSSLPNNPSAAAQTLSQQLGQSFPELANAKEYHTEKWDVAGGQKDLIVLCFLMPTVPEAAAAMDKLIAARNAVAPGPAKQLADNMDIDRNYNLLMVFVSSDKGVRDGYRNRVWECDKTAK
ncbi:MAG: hypothetical protein NTW86_01160 [Candidatus Sumerlaeota bacterium]|nr:hypothetical protein [Candidatus Sumerlaeota bacterium]